MQKTEVFAQTHREGGTERERIAIIIPALNEEEAIQRLLVEIPTTCADWVIVVDNGSSDRTAEVARAAGAIVVSQSIRGYGRACFTGLQKAKELGADMLIFMDGDGSDNPQDIEMMLTPVLDRKADFTIGSRISIHAEAGAVPPQARLGNWLVSSLIRLRYKVPVEDIGSMRVIRTERLEELNMQEMTFGWPVEMLVKAARDRYVIQELPIRYRRRSAGQSKVAGNLIGSIKAAYFMLRTTFRYLLQYPKTDQKKRGKQILLPMAPDPGNTIRTMPNTSSSATPGTRGKYVR